MWERPGPTGQSQGTRCYLERPGSRRVSDHRWLLNCFCPTRPTTQLSGLQGADQALWAVQWQFTLWAEDLGKGHRVYRDTPEGLWHHLACKCLRISGGCSNTALVRWRPVTGYSKPAATKSTMSDVRKNNRIGWMEVFPGHLHHLWPLLDCEDFTPGEEGPTRALLESWRGRNSLVSYSWTFTEPLLRASCVCNSRRLRELRTTIYHNWTLSTLPESEKGLDA